MSLEKTDLTLGFIALADCAALAVAKAHGHFEAEGLNVTLSREPSWANIRDKVAVGALDGAHMLGPMAIAANLGLGGAAAEPLAAPFAMNLNGSAVTVSNALAGALREIDPAAMDARPRTAAPLARLADQRRARGLPPLTFAVVFPYSVHNYELRHWLAAGGVEPDRDVRLVVVPPARMVEKLAAGEIDGFCVTAPWNAVALIQGLGQVLVHACEIWPRSPDKVFAVTARFAKRHPQTTAALIRALERAAAWADPPENRLALGRLLADPAVVDAPEAAMRLFLLGAGASGGHAFDDPDYIIFHRDGANRPLVEHADWFFDQMARWGQLPAGASREAARRAYRPELYDAALDAQKPSGARPEGSS
ncbi:CmpA/NrtA family ABC transporter substrate-binding protein [Phenylobacterium sp.]|uniref:CmpA/NrtA family ABC transporter substrate-binding protein n=1 Tax=Phenylobacterium sp. TaxID=1871053 RepID=UPI0035B1C14D